MDIHRQLNGDAIRQELLKQYSKCGFEVFFPVLITRPLFISR